MTLTAEITIAGAINDEEFRASGEAAGDPGSGEWRLRLDYTNIPNHWHPFLYIDAKVGLLFIKELGGGQNMLTLADGSYRASSSIDFGAGNLVRNNAVIERKDNSTFRAAYLMHGTVRAFDLHEVLTFDEVMVPVGPGRVAGVAIGRWKGLETLEAVMSTRYIFDVARTLDQVQVRRFDCEPTLQGNTFECLYRAEVGVLGALDKVFKGAGKTHALT